MISNVLAAARDGLAGPQRTRLLGWVGYIAVLSLLFAEWLVRLVTHALGNNLHSHIPLVPLITVYLLYIQARPRGLTYQTSVGWALGFLLAGLSLLTVATSFGERLSENDYLAMVTAGYVVLLAAGGFMFLGARWMQAAAFPFSFLVFLIPLPDRAVDWLEMASVYASADASAAIFNLTGTPLLRDGTVFTLPGIVLEVARECSGIRSSWVLFITSVAASNMLLATTWRRLVLIAFVFPLAIVRNAVRIVTIGLLSVHVGPHMADSAIHRQGGPLFFALSLVPLFALLWWLRRQERRSVRSV